MIWKTDSTGCQAKWFVGASYRFKTANSFGCTVHYDKVCASSTDAVSYTHLDVYKRQHMAHVLGEHAEFKGCLLYTSRCV